MAYVGLPIEIGSISHQLLNGGSSSYTLNYNVGSNASIGVYIDGVHQKPGTSYTVAGTTLTFPGGNTPSGTNNICVVFHSLPISLPTPGDQTVSGTKIAMGSDAQGDVLYYNGSQYTRLPKGTAGQALVMNSGATGPEWGQAGGKVLQVVSTVKTDTFTYNATSWGDVTGMSASLTPSSGTKCLVTCCFTYGTSSTYNASARLVRDSTEICVGNADGSRPQTTWGGLYSTLSDNHVHNYSMTFLDTHGANGSTAVTYKLQFNSHDGTAGVMYLNRSLNDSNNNVGARGTSTITAMEVGA